MIAFQPEVCESVCYDGWNSLLDLSKRRFSMFVIEPGRLLRFSHILCLFIIVLLLIIDSHTTTISFKYGTELVQVYQSDSYVLRIVSCLNYPSTNESRNFITSHIQAASSFLYRDPFITDSYTAYL